MKRLLLLSLAVLLLVSLVSAENVKVIPTFAPAANETITSDTNPDSHFMLPDDMPKGKEKPMLEQSYPKISRTSETLTISIPNTNNIAAHNADDVTKPYAVTITKNSVSFPQVDFNKPGAINLKVKSGTTVYIVRRNA